MSRRISHDVLTARNEVVAAPAARACEDHNFGLPPAIHLLTGAFFLGFVSVLCLALANASLAVPFGVFAAFIMAFFAVPAVFVKASPDKGAQALGWTDFLERGIDTSMAGAAAGKRRSWCLCFRPSSFSGRSQSQPSSPWSEKKRSPNPPTLPAGRGPAAGSRAGLRVR